MMLWLYTDTYNPLSLWLVSSPRSLTRSERLLRVRCVLRESRGRHPAAQRPSCSRCSGEGSGALCCGGLPSQPLTVQPHLLERRHWPCVLTHSPQVTFATILQVVSNYFMYEEFTSIPAAPGVDLGGSGEGAVPAYA